MPEKNRFPAVLQPVIPILEAGARTGISTTDPRAGIGIGIDGDPMFTLQSSKQHAVAVMPFNTKQITSPENGSNPQWGDPCFSLAAGNHPPALAISVAVRRLMPVEAERLMGFPDGWTLVPVGKGMAADGPRYKQLGNSWAVPCVSWIGRRLDLHLAELDGMIIDVAPVQSDAMTIWMCAA